MIRHTSRCTQDSLLRLADLSSMNESGGDEESSVMKDHNAPEE